MTSQTTRPLRVLRDGEDLILRERADRAARIDALGVDRSRWEGTVLSRWSLEAEAREPRFEAVRQEVTLSDRLAAWRYFFSLI